MAEVVQFKNFRIIWDVKIAYDLSSAVYGINDNGDGLFLVRIFARSWEEAEHLRNIAEQRAQEEYNKQRK